MRFAIPIALWIGVLGCPTEEPRDEEPPLYEPPGGGIAKGCRESVQYDAPMVEGIGLSSHLEWRDDEVSEARRAFEIDRWAELGARFIRRDLYWTALEPVQGEFDFTLSDRQVEATDSVGGETLALLVYGNPWASAESDDSKTPPDDPADFGNYAAAVAERYRGDIRRFEVWNEPNAGVRFWKPEEDPVAYGELLIEAADRIHGIDPDAQVSLGGLFHPPMFLTTPGPVFLDGVFDAHPDLADHIDAVAFHPYRYPFTAPEEAETQESLTDAICGMFDQLEARGAGDLELWITELGWHTAPEAFVAGVSQEDQAAFLVRSTLLSLAQGVPVFQWYTFRDSGEDITDQEQMFGLYGYDPDPLSGDAAAPKLAASAYATVTDQLGDHDRIEDLSVWLGLDEGTFGYRLTGGGDPVWVLWTTDAAVTVQVPADGDGVLTGMLGDESGIEAMDGAVDVPVDSTPVYLSFP